jgi:tRNA(Ile)-lysidine synthase
MPVFEDRVRATIERHALITRGDQLVVGVSGGADSLALLHVLRVLSADFDLKLHVATLDHGIRGAAGAADAEFVRQIATAWRLPVTVGRADVPAAARKYRLGLEEAARQVRYAFLRQVTLQAGAVKIAVGHNQDDQAETVLMHLIRGSGLSGLRGMMPSTLLSTYRLLDDAAIRLDPPGKHPVSVVPEIALIRPLLETPRREIEIYLNALGLEPRHDATNTDLTYFRNRLRHEVIPLLEQLNPNVRETLARTADVLRADAALVSQAGAAALARTVRVSRADGVILDIHAWDSLSLSEKRHVIRAVVARLRPDQRDVSLAHVDNTIRIADEHVPESAATLPGGLALRVGRGVLTVGPTGADVFEIVPGEDAPALENGFAGIPFLPGDQVSRLFRGWLFEAGPLAPDADLDTIHADPLAAALAVPAGAWLILRTRRPGDRFRPRGLGGQSQKLSNTFNTMKVPAAWRDHVPLLVVDNEIGWFVVPTAQGIRGRQSETFALPDPGPESRIIAVYWRRIDPQNKNLL